MHLFLVLLFCCYDINITITTNVIITIIIIILSLFFAFIIIITVIIITFFFFWYAEPIRQEGSHFGRLLTLACCELKE